MRKFIVQFERKMGEKVTHPFRETKISYRSYIEAQVRSFVHVLREEMKTKVEKLIDHLEDSVIYYFLCEHCREKIEHIGRTPFYLEEEKVEVI